MKKLMQKLANAMAAVAFAEENEPETARELLAETEPPAPEARPDPEGRELPLIPPAHRPLAKSS